MEPVQPSRQEMELQQSLHQPGGMVNTHIVSMDDPMATKIVHTPMSNIYNDQIARGDHQHKYHDYSSISYPSRRGNIIKSFVADWIVVCIILLGCAIYFAEPPGKKYFRLDDPDLSYPDNDDVVFPSILLHILYWIPPLIIISLAQIWIRSFPEWHATALSFVETIAMTYFVTTFLMWSVGRLRPSWLAGCKPNQPIVAGPPYLYYDDSVCTTDRSDRHSHQQSWPSGHAATIFASYTWLFFYLNAKLKIFDGNAHAWKLISFFPFLIATWVSFSRVNDAKHYYFDVCSGIVLGLFLALIGYRLNFLSLWGPDNHIPCRMTWTEATHQVHIGSNRPATNLGRARMHHLRNRASDLAYPAAPATQTTGLPAQ